MHENVWFDFQVDFPVWMVGLVGRSLLLPRLYELLFVVVVL